MVGRPSQRSVSGQKAFPVGQLWLGMFRRAGSGREPSRWASSGRRVLPEVREWSGNPPGGPGMIKRPSRKAGSGQESLPEGREWLGALQEGMEWSSGPTGCPGVDGRPSRWSGSGQESLP